MISGVAVAGSGQGEPGQAALHPRTAGSAPPRPRRSGKADPRDTARPRPASDLFRRAWRERRRRHRSASCLSRSKPGQRLARDPDLFADSGHSSHTVAVGGDDGDNGREQPLQALEVNDLLKAQAVIASGQRAEPLPPPLYFFPAATPEA